MDARAANTCTKSVLTVGAGVMPHNSRPIFPPHSG
jgi:hypothetical protein